jgi:DNA-binding NarL/FixJ family response regulator
MAAEARYVAPPIRILIADDSAPFREELRKLVLSAEGMELLGEATSQEKLLEALREHQPDLILLDMSLSRHEKSDVLTEIGATELPVRILLLANTLDAQRTRQALKYGAHGVLLKESTTKRLFDAVRCILAGRFWVLEQCVPNLYRALHNLPESINEFGLTLREIEIVNWVVAGYSNPEIARQCSISEGAVKHHMSSIFSKLDVANRVELAIFAANHLMVDSSQ